MELSYDLDSGNPPGEVSYSRIIMPYSDGKNNNENWRIASGLWSSLEDHVKLLGLDSVPSLRDMRDIPGIQTYGSFHEDEWNSIYQAIMFTDKVIETKLAYSGD